MHSMVLSTLKLWSDLTLDDIHIAELYFIFTEHGV